MCDRRRHTERGGYACVHVYIVRGRCACAHVYMVRGRCACVHVYITHVCSYGAQRLMVNASLYYSSPCFLRRGLSLHLRLMDSESLTGQWVPGIDSSLICQSWDCRCVCYCAQVLTWVWASRSGSCLALDQLSCSLAYPPYLFWKNSFMGSLLQPMTFKRLGQVGEWLLGTRVIHLEVELLIPVPWVFPVQ